MSIIPPKPEIDFTDELITSKGGLTFLARFASHLGLPEFLAQNPSSRFSTEGLPMSNIFFRLSTLWPLYRYKTVEG